VHVHRRTATDGSSSVGCPDRVIALGKALRERGTGACTNLARSDATGAQATMNTLPFRRELGESAYRRSEQSWDEAGRPTAVVSLEQKADQLLVRVDVPRAERRFLAIDAEKPLRQTIPPRSTATEFSSTSPAGDRAAGWLLVPIVGSTHAPVARPTDGATCFQSMRLGSRQRMDTPLVAAVTLPPRGDDNRRRRARERERSRSNSPAWAARAFGTRAVSSCILRADRHDRDRLLGFALSAQGTGRVT
jgi:hypothetical protein